MKINDKEDGKSTVYIDDDDYVFIVNVADRHSAIHWPKENPNGKELVNLIYHLAQINLNINDRAISLGLSNDEIKAITIAAWEDYTLDKEELKSITDEKEKDFYVGTLMSSGNDRIH